MGIGFINLVNGEMNHIFDKRNIITSGFELKEIVRQRKFPKLLEFSYLLVECIDDQIIHDSAT